MTNKPKRTRRPRSATIPMPSVLDAHHVKSVDPWPLGKVMTRRAAGEFWTDVIIELVGEIRLGGRYNTRRVRYNDGTFYIMHNGRVVPLSSAFAWRVSDLACHVYGLDAGSDHAYNKRAKGY